MVTEATRTLRLKVRAESYAWLDAAAREVNTVWNWANATSMDAADRTRRSNPKWLTGFDLCNLSAGASEYFERIRADTIQRVCCEYALKRRAAQRFRLRWRASKGARRALGWVPFKAVNLKRKGVSLRFAGKSFRVFERERLDGAKWRDGCFAQDAVGDWWLCLPVTVTIERIAPERDAVGVDLGCKDAAVTSDGDRLASGMYRRMEPRIAQAQRRGHKRQAKRLAPQGSQSAARGAAQVFYDARASVRADLRRRREQHPARADPPGQGCVGCGMGYAQDSVAVQVPVGRQRVCSRQREKHHAAMQRLRGLDGSCRSGHARCKTLGMC